eukprot:2225900-Rhodomonas_salina.2
MAVGTGGGEYGRYRASVPTTLPSASRAAPLAERRDPVSAATCLRACYAKSGTSLAYADTDIPY